MTLFEPKTKKNQVFERGSAIIWIFVMVTLFAALGFVVTQGSRSGEGQVTQKQAELAATEILDYASAIKRAVQELQINGCSDTEISFENAIVAGYSNPNAPSNNSCHIFHPNGGGLSYRDAASFESSDSITYVGASDLLGIGINCGDSSCSDLYMRLRLIDDAGKKICGVINQNLGHDSLVPLPVTTHMLGAPEFTGTYTYQNANTVLFDGLQAACFNYSLNQTTNLFYYVLIAR